MPLKKRTRIKGQGKQKASKSKESSSEDTDRCTAEEIVSRLAKKYLLKSSTDTEHSDQKENERSAPKAAAADPYDADLESSEVDTAASVDTSDMECLDAQSVPHILSPSRRANVATRCTRSTTSKGNPNKSKQGAQLSIHPAVVSVRKDSSMTQSKRRHRESRTSSATPQRTSVELEPNPKEDPSLQNDSGMFVSPLTNIPQRYLPKMNASDTSTPTSTIGDVRSDLNDSCFGFESLITPDPLEPISPVDSVSPTGHSALSRSSLSDVSHTRSIRNSTLYTVAPVKRKVSATLDMLSLVQGQQQPVKKPRKKAVKSDATKTSKMQEWAANMAEEFEDIEMNYDLNIEG